MAETIEELEKKIAYYEGSGIAKLFYALNRKMAEMADTLNKSNLSKLDLTDPKDKTFDRMKVIWNDAASLAEAVKSLGSSSGITGDEEKDIARKPFVDTIAESRK